MPRPGQGLPRVKLMPGGPLKPHDVPEVLAYVEVRGTKLFKRRKLLAETPDGYPAPDEFALKNKAMAANIQASLLDSSVLAPDRLVPPMRERGALPDDVKPRSKNCCEQRAFAAVASVGVPLPRPP